MDSLKKQFAEEETKRFEQLKQLGDTIAGIELKFVRKTDEHDNLYGSVSETDILHELKQRNIDIPKTAVLMDKHLKQLGDFEVNIKLHKDVNVVLRGKIEKETEEAQTE